MSSARRRSVKNIQIDPVKPIDEINATQAVVAASAVGVLGTALYYHHKNGLKEKEKVNTTSLGELIDDLKKNNHDVNVRLKKAVEDTFKFKLDFYNKRLVTIAKQLAQVEIKTIKDLCKLGFTKPYGYYFDGKTAQILEKDGSPDQDDKSMEMLRTAMKCNNNMAVRQVIDIAKKTAADINSENIRSIMKKYDLVVLEYSKTVEIIETITNNSDSNLKMNDRVEQIIKTLENFNDTITGDKRASVREEVCKFVKSFINDQDRNNRYLNVALLGPPGSGKTLIAAEFAKVLLILGILVTDHLSVHSRSSLVGRYMGETAQKTRNVLTSGLEGIVFIDEAYSLAQGGDSYGVESINEIVGFLDKHRGQICVIAAGYASEMKKYFFGANPGLQRRFPNIWTLPNYSSEDLITILKKNLKFDKQTNQIPDLNKVFKFIEKNPQLFVNQAGDMEILAEALKQEINASPTNPKIKKVLKNAFRDPKPREWYGLKEIDTDDLVDRAFK